MVPDPLWSDRIDIACSVGMCHILTSLCSVAILPRPVASNITALHLLGTLLWQSNFQLACNTHKNTPLTEMTTHILVC